MGIKIITAQQAAELVEQSDAMIDQYLMKIGHAIEAAAMAGGRTLALNTVFSCDERVTFSLGPHDRKSEHHLFQNRLMAALTSLNYRVQIEEIGEPYVPCGLIDDDGDGPMYQPYAIVIRW